MASLPSFDLCCFSIIEDKPVVKLLPLHNEKNRIISYLGHITLVVDREISIRMSFFKYEFINWIDTKLQNDRAEALEVLDYAKDLLNQVKP